MILVLINLFIVWEMVWTNNLKGIIFRISSMLFLFTYWYNKYYFRWMYNLSTLHVRPYSEHLYGSNIAYFFFVVTKCFDRTRLVVSTKKLVVLHFSVGRFLNGTVVFLGSKILLSALQSSHSIRWKKHSMWWNSAEKEHILCFSETKTANSYDRSST